MTTAVTGATGQLGRLALKALKARARSRPLLALVRSPERATDLGVEARAFDYTQPDVLEPALADVETLVLISSSEVGQRTQQHRNVIEAAKAAQVGHIIYTSLLHAGTSPLDLAEEHRITEGDLSSSGIPHTILRNGWYAENYSGSVPGALAGGALLGSAGSGRISAAARADYAEAIAVVAAGEGARGQTYELAADEAWTLADLAAELSRQVGRDIPYKDLPEADYSDALKNFGLPDGLASAIAGWDVAASNGALFDDGHQLSALIGRRTGSLHDIVATALKSA